MPLPQDYLAPMSAAAALDELRRNSGTQFEPRIVDALALALEGRVAVAA